MSTTTTTTEATAWPFAAPFTDAVRASSTFGLFTANPNRGALIALVATTGPAQIHTWDHADGKRRSDRAKAALALRWVYEMPADAGELREVCRQAAAATLDLLVRETYDDENAPLVIAALTGHEAFEAYAGERLYDLFPELQRLAGTYWDGDLDDAVQGLIRHFYPAAEPAVA